MRELEETMSWIDRKGKRYMTKEDVEHARLMADEITKRLLPRIEKRIEEAETKRPPTVTEGDLVRKHFQQDLEKLSRLPGSAFRLFVFLFKNGRSHLLDIKRDSGIPQRTIYHALKRLKEADLIDKNHEDCWFIRAKGFISLA